MESLPDFREFYAARNRMPLGEWGHLGEQYEDVLRRFMDTAADYLDAGRAALSVGESNDA